MALSAHDNMVDPFTLSSLSNFCLSSMNWANKRKTFTGSPSGSAVSFFWPIGRVTCDRARYKQQNLAGRAPLESSISHPEPQGKPTVVYWAAELRSYGCTLAAGQAGIQGLICICSFVMKELHFPQDLWSREFPSKRFQCWAGKKNCQCLLLTEMQLVDSL